MRLRIGWPGFNSRQGKVWNFSLRHHVQTDTGAHIASYPTRARGSFPGGKAAGVWNSPLHHSPTTTLHSVTTRKTSIWMLVIVQSVQKLLSSILLCKTPELKTHERAVIKDASYGCETFSFTQYHVIKSEPPFSVWLITNTSRRE
jgi:hypothetical protein